MAAQQRIGAQADRTLGGVLDPLGDREHVILIDRDGAREDKAGPVVPGQNDRGFGGQLAVTLNSPERVFTGNGGGIDTRNGDPAIQRIERIAFGFGAQDGDLGRIGVEVGQVVLQLEVIQTAAAQVDRAGEARGVDLQAGGRFIGLDRGGRRGRRGGRCRLLRRGRHRRGLFRLGAFRGRHGVRILGRFGRRE